MPRAFECSLSSRRSRPRRRGPRVHRPFALACTAAVTGPAVLADSAGGAVLHFVNPAPGQPGHYPWRWEPVDGWQSWLDITLAPGSQTGHPNPNAIGQLLHPWGNVHSEDPGSPNQRALVMALFGIVPSTLAMSLGEPLVEGSEFGFHEGAIHVDAAGGSGFVEGEPAYAGVMTSGGSLGWIKVVRSGMSLTALEWAYQTMPGAPMFAGQIPAPGAAVLLSLASAAALRRRRS